MNRHPLFMSPLLLALFGISCAATTAPSQAPPQGQSALGMDALPQLVTEVCGRLFDCQTPTSEFFPNEDACQQEMTRQVFLMKHRHPACIPLSIEFLQCMNEQLVACDERNAEAVCEAHFNPRIEALGCAR